MTAGEAAMASGQGPSARLDAPDWTREGADWPLREASRFVTASGIDWHVQRLGRGPVLLALHGTGAATHSWRDLAPRLAEHFDLIAPDLPGHGFTSAPPRGGYALAAMAASIAALLQSLDAKPVMAIGHSAGAAIALELVRTHAIAQAGVVSLNGALLPWPGLSGAVFSIAAKLLEANRLVPNWFARRARDPRAVERLVASTGSTLDDRGMALYGALVGRAGHASAALSMMASWNLESLARALPTLRVPLALVVGDNDRTVPPSQAERVKRLVPEAELVRLPGLGHLAHEEAPDEVAQRVVDFARRWNVLP